MAAEEARKEEVKNEAKEEEAKQEQVKDDAKEEEAKKEQVKGEAKQEEAKKQEEVEIELVSDTTAFKLSKECATETFYGSGDNIPPSLLEKKKRQYAKWKQVQIEKGKILKKGKWSKQLDSIDETTKATKKDTTEIKATTKDIQIKTDQLLDEQKALPEKLFEAIDKKNKAVYGKPRDQVDMALHLASQQVPVKVLNAILSDCGTNMKGSKMDKAKWIADKAKEKPEEITALLEKHATSEPPAKRQRRVSDWARKAGGDIERRSFEACTRERPSARTSSKSREAGPLLKSVQNQSVANSSEQLIGEQLNIVYFQSHSWPLPEYSSDCRHNECIFTS